MRPIKFRAWDAIEERMWFPFAISCGDEPCGIFMGVILMRDHQSDLLMQFTGLLDKNGKAIYEGDILTIDERKSIVRFGIGSYDSGVYHFAGFYLESINGEQEENTWWVDEEQKGRRLVIGNIHEHPALLK